VLIQNKVAKITDFGQSKSMESWQEKDKPQKQTLQVGSPYYRAIQLL
jgi:serine/threonine protein kinase